MKIHFDKIHWHQRWKRLEENRFFIIVLCLFVGILAGVASTAMHYVGIRAGAILDWTRENFGENSKYLLPLIPGLAVLFCILFGKALFSRYGGYHCSLTRAVSAARSRKANLPLYHTFCHIFTCGLSVGCGISAGMEAPSALTGAAIGSNAGSFLHLNRESRTLLMAAGSAAAIAAIFNSPMAGVLFACEILLPTISAVSLIPLLIAAAASAITAKLLHGEVMLPDLRLAWDFSQVAFYSLLGLTTGLISVFMIKVNLSIHNLFRRVRSIWVRSIIGAAVIYAFFFCFPSLAGNGFNHILSFFNGTPEDIPVRALGPLVGIDPLLGLTFAICLLCFLKPIISSICLESGGDGGIFGPSLFVGAFFGYFFASILKLSGFADIPYINCVVLGMAGIIAGVMHAPLTGLFLIAEILGNYEMLIPLMIVVALSSLVCKVISRTNIYMSFLTNDNPNGREDRSTEDLVQQPVRDFTETDYYPLMAGDTLYSLLQVMVASKKNIFPVLDKNNHLLGVVLEEHIRSFVLNDQIRYQFIVEDFMGAVNDAISADATLYEATKKFDTLQTWYLPVVESDGRFLGFISKASLINNYRQFMTEKEIF